MENQLPPDYAWWVDYKGVWELKQAANLYLGFDPDKGGTFYMIDDLLKNHDCGLILTDSDTVWSVQALKKKDTSNKESRLEWDDVFDKDGNSKVSLQAFVKGRVLAGDIKQILDNDDIPSGMYFKPIEVIAFFQKHFLNKPPQELLQELGLNARQRKKADPLSPAALTKAYKKYVADYESEDSLPSWKDDKTAITSALGKQPTDKQIKNVRAQLAPKSWKKRGRKKVS